LSKEYAEAKELALAGACPLPLLDMCIFLLLYVRLRTQRRSFLIQTVEVEDAKHLLQSEKLLGDKIDEVVKEWDVQKEGFYQRSGLSSSPGNQLMAVDNDESGAQCHEDGSRGDQLMGVDNDESGVQTGSRGR
jgi:snRNA-activating protein complex subunit 1